VEAVVFVVIAFARISNDLVVGSLELPPPVTLSILVDIKRHLHIVEKNKKSLFLTDTLKGLIVGFHVHEKSSVSIALNVTLCQWIKDL